MLRYALDRYFQWNYFYSVIRMHQGALNAPNFSRGCVIRNRCCLIITVVMIVVNCWETIHTLRRNASSAVVFHYCPLRLIYITTLLRVVYELSVRCWLS